MRTMERCWPDLPMARGTFRRDTAVPVDLRVVLVWSTVGLALATLFLILGFGAEIGVALAAAG